MKTCSKCGKEKEYSEFYKDKKKLDGLFNSCKECEILKSRKWKAENQDKIKEYSNRNYKENKEKINNWSKEWYQRNKESVIIAKRQYRKDNSEKITAKRKEFYYSNRELVLSRCSNWAKNNPEKARQKVMRREAIKRKATVGIVSYNEILKRDGYVCHICNGVVSKGDVHFDHVIPLSRGGQHSMDNIKVSHAHCNLVKNNKLMSEFVPVYVTKREDY